MIRIAVTSRAIEAVAEALSLGFILYETEATAGASGSSGSRPGAGTDLLGRSSLGALFPPNEKGPAQK